MSENVTRIDILFGHATLRPSIAVFVRPFRARNWGKGRSRAAAKRRKLRASWPWWQR